MTASTVTALRNARDREGRALDLYFDGAEVAAARPADPGRPLAAGELDAGGLLLLPALVDGHVHLDKTHAGIRWIPHAAGPDRDSRIVTEKRMRDDLPPVAGRAASLLRQAVASGTRAVRTHVDIDPDLGLRHLHALLALRERYRGLVHMEIVAFPQSGVRRCPGTLALLEAAIEAGADLLGGIDPLTLDGDLDGQLDDLFEVAARRDVGLDIHLHDAGPRGLAEIRAFVERVRAHGLRGRATVSHGFALGAAAPPEFAAAASAMADAGVALVTHGGGASPLPPLKALREHGVHVFAGNDNVRDSWNPLGTGDMLERAMLLAWRSGFRTDADLELALACASDHGAQALGLPVAGVVPGARADLVAVAAECAAEAVAQRPVRSLVLHGARLVARDGELLFDDDPAAGAA
jgi:cytosine deaminase